MLLSGCLGVTSVLLSGFKGVLGARVLLSGCLGVTSVLLSSFKGVLGARVLSG